MLQRVTSSPFINCRSCRGLAHVPAAAGPLQLLRPSVRAQAWAYPPLGRYCRRPAWSIIHSFRRSSNSASQPPVDR